MFRTLLLSGIVALAGLWGVYSTRAEAHPHVWITVEATVLYDNGAFSGVAHKWTFDEFYSTMAVEGLDTNKDGKYDREELAELAKVNMDGLKEFSYFTFAKLAGQELKLAEPRDAWLEHENGVLSLHFILPFAQPVLPEAKGLSFAVYDPTYFIAFTLAKTDPVKLAKGAPPTCKVAIDAPTKESGNASALGGAFASQMPGPAISIGKPVSIECGNG